MASQKQVISFDRFRRAKADDLARRQADADRAKMRRDGAPPVKDAAAGDPHDPNITSAGSA